MRKIDRRLGVSICFFLSLINRFSKWIRKKPLVTSPKKILFIQISEMGSIILAYPLFQKTKKKFPEAELYFLTFLENRPVVELLEIFPAANILTVNSRNLWNFFFSTLRTFVSLRKLQMDLTLDLELFSRFTAILSFLSGSRSRSGFYKFHNEGLYRGSLLTHKTSYNPHIHIAFNFINLIDSFLFPETEEPAPKIPKDPADIILPKKEFNLPEEQWIREKLKAENPSVVDAKTIILMNPNASERIPIRRWPAERYIKLAKRLLQHTGIFIILTGTSSEREEAERMSSAIGSKRCLNLAGRTTFSELIDLYNISDILITNDSGPVHFSVLTEIRSFVFFGPETPKLYGPLGKNSHVFYANYSCSPCVSAYNQRRSACKDNKCLQAISVDEVYKEIYPFL
ncbi:MAG: glycosyltransferase family 9 protein [Candidatus Aminicenantes bacterium]|nr:glycosyltransferase family 9 protein [Candidatus Aminicenantes bacterium]